MCGLHRSFATSLIAIIFDGHEQKKSNFSFVKVLFESLRGAYIYSLCENYTALTLVINDVKNPLSPHSGIPT